MVVPNDADLYAAQPNSDWLFITLSTELKADWFILENNEEATLHINMPYLSFYILN